MAFIPVRFPSLAAVSKKKSLDQELDSIDLIGHSNLRSFSIAVLIVCFVGSDWLIPQR